jgi:hypothetical protein
VYTPWSSCCTHAHAVHAARAEDTGASAAAVAATVSGRSPTIRYYAAVVGCCNRCTRYEGRYYYYYYYYYCRGACAGGLSFLFRTPPLCFIKVRPSIRTVYNARSLRAHYYYCILGDRAHPSD